MWALKASSEMKKTKVKPKKMKILKVMDIYLLLCICLYGFTSNGVACGAGLVLPGTGNPSPRLPRTSASQLNNGTVNRTVLKNHVNGMRSGNLRSREQQLLNIFEVVISTLESKLKRIDNLDKAVENLMRRVETLDNRVGDNILKTESVISKLRSLGNKISHESIEIKKGSATSNNVETKHSIVSQPNLDSRLVTLDQKVTDIDSKLEGLKSQIDNNFLQVDDFNAEASEKKPISMNVIEITKAMNAEVMNHMTNELGHLRTTTDNIDKKLQFHINIVSDNVGRMLQMVNEIHEAVVDHNELYNNLNISSTTTPLSIIKSSKIDALVKQIKPIMSVSEKMDEVWNVVVGTKSSVDHLVPKSDELLTQTQRQERAIGEIHHDLKTKTNLIITNLDMVEKRLKKQEDDVSMLAQRPVSADLFMDPTIDRLIEYDPNKYSVIEDYTEPVFGTTFPTPSSSTIPTIATSTINITTPSPIFESIQSSASTVRTSTQPTNQLNITTVAAPVSPTLKPVSRKGGIIFPSIKNKPSVQNNSTFATDILSLKDVKVS